MAGDSLAEAKSLHLPSRFGDLPAHWSWLRLEDACEGVFDCPHSTPKLVSTGPFVVRSQDIITGIFRTEKAARVSEETYRERTLRVVPARGDILYSREGTYFGIAAEVPKDARVCLGQRMVLIRPKDGVMDFRFLRHWLNSPIMASHIHGYRDGSVAERLNLPTIRALPVVVPPIREQRGIAHILGTLDDKIELNRRMNETLEAMARALFKSWFVDFDPVRARAEGRYPGLPGPLADLFPDSFEDSELGEVPRGWRAGRLNDLLAELVSGARPKGGAVEEGVPSVGAENVIGLGRYDFSKEKYVPQAFFERLKLNGAAVRAGDVLLYKDGAQIGRKTYFDCDFPHAECAINEHVFILRPRRSEEQRFLFFWLDQASMTQEIVSLNSNSAQPGINQPGVRGLPVLLPKDEVVDAFDQLAVRLTTRLFANCKESRTLAALRDALLPKLISGELRVSDAAASLGNSAG
jgi:type I restriction enzyme S subunit